MIATLGAEGVLKVRPPSRDFATWYEHDANWSFAMLDGTQVAVPTAGRPLAFSPDGTRLAVGTAAGTVKVFDAATGRVRLGFPAHASAVRWVGFSPDGASVITCGTGIDRVVRVWDAHSGRPESAIRGHRTAPNDAAVSPDGRFLVTRASEDLTRVWDLTARPEACPLAASDPRGGESADRPMAFDPTGRFLAAAHPRGCVVLDAATGEQVRSHAMHAALVSPPVDVTFDTDGAIRLLTTTHLYTFAADGHANDQELTPAPFTGGTGIVSIKGGSGGPPREARPLIPAAGQVARTGTVVYRTDTKAYRLTH